MDIKHFPYNLMNKCLHRRKCYFRSLLLLSNHNSSVVTEKHPGSRRSHSVGYILISRKPCYRAGRRFYAKSMKVRGVHRTPSRVIGAWIRWRHGRMGTLWRFTSSSSTRPTWPLASLRSESIVSDGLLPGTLALSPPSITAALHQAYIQASNGGDPGSKVTRPLLDSRYKVSQWSRDASASYIV